MDRSLVHKAAIGALERPEGLHRSRDGYLVDVWIGPHKVGYLVAQVLPRMVFIKTFLFLTMQGTPESELLRGKLGLGRSDVERYKLDEFHTLTGTDIIKDPLLARVLGECGCGHLLSLVDPDIRMPWVDLHDAPVQGAIPHPGSEGRLQGRGEMDAVERSTSRVGRMIVRRRRAGGARPTSWPRPP